MGSEATLHYFDRSLVESTEDFIVARLQDILEQPFIVDLNSSLEVILEGYGRAIVVAMVTYSSFKRPS